MSNGVATCSLDQSDGIDFVMQPAGGAVDPGGVKRIDVTGLTKPIKPAAGSNGVRLVYDLISVSPAGAGAAGVAPPALTVTTDGSRAIDVVTSAANILLPFPLNAAIAVFGRGGRGNDNGINQDAGAGAAGPAVTITNAAAVTEKLNNTPQSRAVAFGLQGSLSDATNAKQWMEDALACLGNNACDVNASASVVYFGCFYGNTGLRLVNNGVGICVGASPTIDREALTAKINSARDTVIKQIAFLNGAPAPGEGGTRILGAIAATTIGGNGGNSAGFFASGNGGSGGKGGDITIDNTAAVNVSAASGATGGNSAGISAVSQGGNGGVGGLFSVNFTAATGGDGGKITITNSGVISTTVVSSPGIYAQSIGGTQGMTRTPAGMGGAISVTTTGAIVTTGDNSFGIFAQSLGGTGGGGSKGGNGGDAFADLRATITTSGKAAYGIYVSSVGGVGGHGIGSGDGGDGGDSSLASALVGVTGSITTTGDDAIGVFATSRAGGGGQGGSDSGIFYADAGGGGSGGAGGDASIVNRGAISTSGTAAHGVFAQSLGGTGGGGGDAGGLVASSGSGGGGAPAGKAAADNYGSIRTTGEGAIGLFVQSVAGLGGDAGSAGGFVSLGSDGGSGAAAQCAANPSKCLNGGDVTARNFGSIATTGVGAYGILAETIGGGGGNGGHASGVFSFGGGGGAGGNGGLLNVLNTGSISATGNQSFGIFAQSVGGGGGNGGDALSVGAFVSGGIGGRGGSGGTGGVVNVTNNGAINVSGINTIGIFAQSVGGGGGRGGSATAISAGAFISASFAVGGHGGGGGAASAVNVTNGGTISTAGDFSDAVFAQSVGGGGGQGGSAFALSFAAGPQFAIAASVAVGGDGGGGGDGSIVTVNNTGSIVTLDWDSRGIFAQSVGGGGGDGGSSSAKALAGSKGASAAVSIAIGGKGGNGGVGGEVDVINSGSILTYGEQSYAVFAQSVGGGGGNGGDASSTTYTLTAGKAANVNVSVGGDGGSGNNGGIVNVINNGSIIALGNEARGITAQSIGGGGGNGGAGTQEDLFDFIDLPGEFDDDLFNKGPKDKAKAKFDALKKSVKDLLAHPGTFGKDLIKDQLNDLTKKPESIGVSIGIGGKGGAGGFGGPVTVTNTKEIITGGFLGFGIFAQSVGGGGGAGGGGEASGTGDINVGFGLGGSSGGAGRGGTATVNNTGDVTTFGGMAYAIFAQSVGGGGGVAGAGGGESEGARSLSLSIGGIAGSAGDGDLVKVIQNGNIVTTGDNSIGILAQSVGGGGGVGGAANGANYLNVSIGGKGGAGGNGGAVDVIVNGSIATVGLLAHAVFAQSIGGGGGLGGAVEAKTLEIGVAPLGLYSVDTGVPFAVGVVGFGGAGGGSGNGGDVKISTAGTISTAGRGANGIFAQSIGGGGGSGGQSNLPIVGGISINGSNGGVGIAGKIDITHSGSTYATGVNANGILAQSMGGGTVATVTPPPAGCFFCVPITTYSASNPLGLGDNITITLKGGGTVSGGTGAAAGILLAGGKDNKIDNQGGVITALSGLAILGGAGNDVVENKGIVRGTVGLGGGTNSFHNAATGLFETGRFIFINAGASTLVNDGTISPGGSAIAGSTLMTGNLTQSATGVLLVDANFKGGASDLIAMDGSAILAGKAVLGPHHVVDLVVGGYKTVLTASTVTSSGITIDDTLTIDYDVRVQGGNALQVGVKSINFIIPGTVLTPNQAVIADHLNKIYVAGGSAGMTPLMDYLSELTNPAAFAALMGSLDPSTVTPLSSSMLMTGGTLTGGLMSCPGSINPADSLREHDCYWGRILTTEMNQRATASILPYGNHAITFQLGRQFELSPEWFLGFTAGYEHNTFNSGLAASGGSQMFTGGAVLKYQSDGWTFAVGGTGSYSDARLKRVVLFPAAITASSSPEQYFFDGKAKVSYLALWDGGFYAKPTMEADLYYVNAPGFHETGAGALNIITRDTTKLFGSGSAGLEFGGLLDHVVEGSLFRPYISGGILAYTDNRWKVKARFEGTPAAVPDFTVANGFPGLLGRITAGLEASRDRSSIRLEYEGHVGGHYTDHTGSLKLELRL